MSDNGNAAGFGVGLLIGAVIGVALGLLYAPRPGSETRAIIREKAARAKDSPEEIIEEARERAKMIIEDAKRKAAGPQEKG